jgi:hypothetical protein
LRYLQRNFPAARSPAARARNERDRAVYAAILDKLEFFDARGIQVRSCEFSNHQHCRLESGADIGPLTQEKLLQGLVRLEEKVRNGQEKRKRITLVDFRWFAPQRMEKDQFNYRNRFWSNAKLKHRTRDLIEMYMDDGDLDRDLLADGAAIDSFSFELKQDGGRVGEVLTDPVDGGGVQAR